MRAMTISRMFAATVVTAAIVSIGSAPVAAHNHVLTPSGACHQSGMGTSPGNSGEGTVNPGGHGVARAEAGAAQGAEHCRKP